ncbi:hypothetical protein C6P46_001369 [Rhodotorula mucilaginosa]|uniref:F-box domain-containing protein n=1 Tax=Rhodotorula mucilaginosa TaxID=5537 RepID=A0A9P6VVF9_RHOMI|nr:hypothetical protein C6P46_001369 [Rhodotorula mucilaginosa]TKA51618.1 hypothetical protein B0A53_05495 [Rhodotorula sp. CCFEE 5036]
MATAAVLCAPQTPSQWIWKAGPRGPRGSEVKWTSIIVTPSRSQTTPSTASPRRPSDFQLLHSLPTELLEFTFEYLALGDLLRLRCVDRALNRILADARHYHNISLSHVSSSAQQLDAVASLLPGTRHLVLRSSSSAALSALLPACSHRLTTLDLSFSGVTDADLRFITGAGKRRRRQQGGFDDPVVAHLRSLKLKGCRHISDFLTWTRTSDHDERHLEAPQGEGKGLATGLSRLHTLDLSWSSISSLPLPLAEHLPALAHLNLSTTPYLSRQVLIGTISTLPTSMSHLDLSHLDLTAKDLTNLAFSSSSALPTIPSCPDQKDHHRRGRPLKLVLAGNDHLTISSLSSLERHWCAGLLPPPMSRSIEIEHGGLMLESDEEEDVRRFVEMVAGVVMREGRSSSAADEPSSSS